MGGKREAAAGAAVLVLLTVVPVEPLPNVAENNNNRHFEGYTMSEFFSFCIFYFDMRRY